MNVVVMLAGGNRGFSKDGQTYHKLLTEINGMTMIEIALRGLKSLMTPENNFICLIDKADNDRYYLSDVIKLIYPHAKVVLIEGETAGAATTSLLAVDYIEESHPLVLLNGDQYIEQSVNEIIDFFVDRKSDAGVPIFNSLHPRWSYVKTDVNGYVIESAEKKPISEKATVGLYYYRKASDYIECAKKMILKGASVNDKFYVCPVFNEMILKQKKILTYQIESNRYHSFMTLKKTQDFEKLGKHID